VAGSLELDGGGERGSSSNVKQGQQILNTQKKKKFKKTKEK
jgi:hypothetical protein